MPHLYIMKYIHSFTRKDKIIYGIMLNIMLTGITGTFLDYQDRSSLALAQITIVFFTFLLMLQYKYTKNQPFLLYSMSFLIHIGSITMLYIDDFHFYGYMFPLLFPLGPFFTMQLRPALSITIVHYIVLIAISFYAYYGLHIHSEVFEAHALGIYIFSAAFILSFGLIYQLSIEHAFQELKTSNDKNNYLLKEVHHRVKNNLNIIASMLGLQGMESGNKKIEEIFETNRSRVESMAMVHELLYRQEDFSVISFKQYVERLSTHLLQMSERHIHVTQEIVDVSFPIQTMQQFSIILNELITNSLKYAFPETIHAPHILVRLTQDIDFFTLYYEDNGIGCESQDFETSNSIGSEIITIACQQLNAKTQMIYTNGFKYTIRFPHVH